jgi:hypothetical protein
MKKLISFCLSSLLFTVVGFAFSVEFQSTLVDTLVKLAGIGLLYGATQLFPTPLTPEQCRAGYVWIYQRDRRV